MRKLNFGLVLGLLMVSSSGAFACEYQMAQVIGVVVGDYDVMTSENTSECWYQIKFTRFDAHGECPLDIEDAVKAEFRDAKCELNNGDIVSGYIVKHGNSITID